MRRILWGVFLICGTASATTPMPAELTGVFVHSSDGSFELSVQLVVTTSKRGEQVILRCGRGALSGVPEVVPAHIVKGSLTFSLPESNLSDCPEGAYEGRFRVSGGVAEALSIQVPSSRAELELERVSGVEPGGFFYPYQ